MLLVNYLKKPLVMFVFGFTVALFFGFFSDSFPPSARADQYSCIRTDLNAQGMTGNIPDPEFTITYEVPACYKQNGYSVQRVYMYGDQIAVHYAK